MPLYARADMLAGAFLSSLPRVDLTNTCSFVMRDEDLALNCDTLTLEQSVADLAVLVQLTTEALHMTLSLTKWCMEGHVSSLLACGVLLRMSGSASGSRAPYHAKYCAVLTCWPSNTSACGYCS